MKKILLSIIFLLGFISFSFAQTNIPKWKITDVEKYMSSGKDEVLVINFWATFCKPCVAEIPSFIEITNQYKDQNVKLLLVSLDLPSFYPKKIAAFAKKQNWTADIVWLDETNADYFCPKIDQKWSGSIPATLILNPKTGYRKFFEEEMKKDKFEAAVKEAIGK
ncbi:MAG: TlpA family protein disulfide reductase [Sphingobacteriales bacterium]|nr:MAG: TlpA family protein disulfide reductase [Sphingobacteriales bacterium]